ncbi:MAG: transcription repressor NadR [Sarcina sp.]
MNATERRKEIINILKNYNGPISATSIANELDVSRQVIVGDVALLRAAGEEILSTTKGYILKNDDSNKDYITKIIACIHDKDSIEDELNIIVDEGATVVDVIVDHGAYGKITGDLHLSSRRDIKEFVKKLNECDVNPLSQLTGGVHLHTIKYKNEEIFNEIIKQLRGKGYIL